jgi:hypothetical protein
MAFLIIKLNNYVKNSKPIEEKAQHISQTCYLIWLSFYWNYMPACSLFVIVWQVKQMLIALLCESEMKLADETVEIILDKVNYCWITLDFTCLF